MMPASFARIPVRESTRNELERLRKALDGTYDDLLQKLLELVPKGDDEGQYTDEFRMGLLQARIDLLKGRKVSHEELKRKLRA